TVYLNSVQPLGDNLVVNMRGRGEPIRPDWKFDLILSWNTGGMLR
ncbi:MAG: hypothetical protein ACI9HA_000961, partial [Dinoroseobacter sp.]